MNLSQADCRAIFDAVSDAILIHDVATGEILEVNRGMCEMFGYTPEEARRLTVTALGGSEAGAEPAIGLLALAAAEGPQVFEWQARDRAGRVFWVEAHLKPIRFGGRDRVLAVLRDIHQRKRAEEALQESEARYRVVTEGSLAGVYIIQDGGFVYVNPTMAQIFGYQPEEMMAGAVAPRDLIHPEDLPLVRENIRRRLSGELEAAHYTFRGLHRDGTVIHCESFGRAVEYQGRPAIVGTLLDITERQKTQEALQKSKTHYQALFEDSPISLWQEDLTDLRAYLKNLRDSGVRDARAYFEAHPEEVQRCAALIKVVDINRATLEIYEADSKEQILTSIASTFSPESYPAFKEAIIALAEGQTWFETETVTTTLTGRKNHILLRLRVLPGPESAGNEVLASIVDITESKRAAEALQTQTRVLESMAEGVAMIDADGTDHVIPTRPSSHVRLSAGGINRATDNSVKRFFRPRRAPGLPGKWSSSCRRNAPCRGRSGTAGKTEPPFLRMPGSVPWKSPARNVGLQSRRTLPSAGRWRRRCGRARPATALSPKGRWRESI